MNKNLEKVRDLQKMVVGNINAIAGKYTYVLKEYHTELNEERLEFAKREKWLLDDKLTYWNKELRFYDWLESNIGNEELSTNAFFNEVRSLRKKYESEVK